MGNTLSGQASKQAVREVFEEKLPQSERYLGLENFGNTCYVNRYVDQLSACLPVSKQAHSSLWVFALVCNPASSRRCTFASSSGTR